MDIISIIAAFGGGVIGAYLGAVPAFIMTGVFALVGAVTGIGFATGVMAFGVFLSPAVAFGGGVAAAAYAGKKGKLASGADVTSALNGLGSPDVLVVGGIFGIIGWLCQYAASRIPAGFGTDNPGVGVIIVGIISRLVFGKTGILGKYENGEKKQLITSSALGNNLVLGAALGLVIGCIYAGAPADVRPNLAVIVFGFSAITLAFAVMGLATPATHHITLPSALGAAAFCAVMGGSAAGAIIGGIVFGVLGSILGDFFGNLLNSHCDSHIDPPACTIVTLTFLANIITTIGA